MNALVDHPLPKKLPSPRDNSDGTANIFLSTQFPQETKKLVSWLKQKDKRRRQGVISSIASISSTGNTTIKAAESGQAKQRQTQNV